MIFITKSDKQRSAPLYWCGRYLPDRRCVIWPLLVVVRLKCMANPQCEEGFVRIATEIWDALCRIRIPGQVRQVVDVIIRKTWGYNKKWDWISLSQFSSLTGLRKPNIIRALHKAESMNLIIKKDNGIILTDNGLGVSYCINKDYETWKPLSEKITLSKKITGVILTDNLSLSKQIPTIDNTTIDNITKDIPSPKKSARSTPEKKTLKSESDHHKAIKYFCDAYQAKQGVPYHFTKGKDGMLVKRLLTTYGFDFFCRLVDQIHITNDEFIISKGKVSIGVLSACANKLAQEIINRSDIRTAFSEKERQAAVNIAKGLGLETKSLEIKHEQ